MRKPLLGQFQAKAKSRSHSGHHIDLIAGCDLQALSPELEIAVNKLNQLHFKSRSGIHKIIQKYYVRLSDILR